MNEGKAGFGLIIDEVFRHRKLLENPQYITAREFFTAQLPPTGINYAAKVESLFAGIKATGWLVRTSTEEAYRVDPRIDSDIDEDDRSEDESNSSLPEEDSKGQTFNEFDIFMNEASTKLLDPDEAAYEQFKKGLEAMRHPFDKPSAYMDKALDPKVMREASQNKENFPDGWKDGLKEYQKDGVGRILSTMNGMNGTGMGLLVADEMGLGKTIQTIAVMAESPREPTIIVLPPTLISNWLEELQKWWSPCPKIVVFDPGMKVAFLETYDIILVSYYRVQLEHKALVDFTTSMHHRMRWPYPHRYERQIGTKRKPKLQPLSLRRPRTPITITRWKRAILDESHQIRNSTTNMAKGCFSLIAPHRISLSGTPFQNDYRDFVSQSKFLQVYPLNDSLWCQAHFFRMKRDHDQKDGEFKNIRKGEVAQLEVNRQAILYLLLLPQLLRRKAEGIFNDQPLLRLPPIQRIEILIHLDDGTKYGGVDWTYNGKTHQEATTAGYNVKPTTRTTVAEFYDWMDGNITLNDREVARKFSQDMKDLWPSTEKEVQYPSRLQWCNNLREIVTEDFGDLPVEEKRQALVMISQGILGAFHPALVKGAYDVSKMVTNDDQDDEVAPLKSKDKGKRAAFLKWLEVGDRWKSTKSEMCVDKVKADLQKDPSNRWIITAVSVAALDIVAQGLKVNGIKFVRIDGSCNQKLRIESRERFMSSKPGDAVHVLLLSSQAGGAGLNLTSGNRLMIVIPGWAPKIESQVEGREWRIGQKRPVIIYRLIAPQSMDSRVQQRQRAKEAKEFGLIDLFTLDPSKLTKSQLELKDKTIQRIKEMESWDEDDFKKGLTGIEVKAKAQNTLGGHSILIEDSDEEEDDEEDGDDLSDFIVSDEIEVRPSKSSKYSRPENSEDDYSESDSNNSNTKDDPDYEPEDSGRAKYTSTSRRSQKESRREFQADSKEGGRVEPNLGYMGASGSRTSPNTTRYNDDMNDSGMNYGGRNSSTHNLGFGGYHNDGTVFGAPYNTRRSQPAFAMGSTAIRSDFGAIQNPSQYAPYAPGSSRETPQTYGGGGSFTHDKQTAKKQDWGVYDEYDEVLDE